MSTFWRSMLACIIITALARFSKGDERPWVMHTIDDASQGADGVRLADVNADGRLDVVTGWEEGGVIRICRNPGPVSVTEKWPSVEVGQVKSPEDAVLVDVDRDGALDVISCCEGKTRTVFVHWAPPHADRYWDASAWETQAIPSTAGKQMWMFCLPMPRDTVTAGDDGDLMLIVGSKGPEASISRLSPGRDPRDVSQWTLTALISAGWIMSLRAVDMDRDGDADVLSSDRREQTRGVKWLENTGSARETWPVHPIGGTELEMMFLGVGDLDGDARPEVVAPSRHSGLQLYRQSSDSDASWTTHVIPLPEVGGAGKAVEVGDMNLDGRMDLVVSTGDAKDKQGVYWMSADEVSVNDGITGDWTMHPISGTERGVKFDRLELLDLDADGDLDVMTCEERDNLGVVWYENPTR